MENAKLPLVQICFIAIACGVISASKLPLAHNLELILDALDG